MLTMFLTCDNGLISAIFLRNLCVQKPKPVRSLRNLCVTIDQYDRGDKNTHTQTKKETIPIPHMLEAQPAFALLLAVVVVALLFYVHGKHLRSCRDGQLT